MRYRALGVATLGAALLVAGSATAQAPTSATGSAGRGSFGVVPFAGYLITETLVEGPLSTSVGAANAPLYGAQLSLPLMGWASLVGTLGYASSDLEAGVPVLGGISVGESHTWLFDAALELRPESWMSSGYRFIPVVQVGGGALRRELSVSGVVAESTDFAVSAGVGADFPLGSNVAVRLLAKDHYGKVDFGSLGPVSARTEGLHTVALSGGLRISF